MSVSDTHKTPQIRKCTAKQLKFAQLVVKGLAQFEAYKQAYNRPDMPNNRAYVESCKNAKIPHVAAEISRLRSKSECKTILSLNDRLAILARDAQIPSDAP